MSVFPPGHVLRGRYEVLRAHAGGMGVVYLCADRQGGRPVAVKTLRADVLADARARESFLQEATAWTRIAPHPHVVRADGVFVDESDVPYLVLEYVAAAEGARDASLRRRLAGGRAMPPSTALLVALEVARGMRHASACVPGLVHRDLKPENILVGVDGLARVTDFGLAVAPSAAGLTAAFTTTDTGEPAGTPLYMPPEQWRQGPVDARADVYSFGCILYELLCGAPPVLANSLADLAKLHLAGAAQRAPIPAAWPAELGALVSACLAADPAARPAGWHVVEPALERIYALVVGRPAPVLPTPEQKAWMDHRALGGSTIALGIASMAIGRTDAAIAYGKRALEIAAEARDPALEAAALNNVAIAHRARGELAEAESALARCLALRRANGDRSGEARTLSNLATLLVSKGQDAVAAQSFSDAIAGLRASGDEAAAMGASIELASVLARLGRVPEAIDLAERASAFFEASQDRRRAAAALGTLGQLARRGGDLTRALACSERALAIFRALADRTGEARELSIQGHTALAARDKARAVRCFDESLKLAEELGDALLVASNAYALAPAFAEMGSVKREPGPFRVGLDLARRAERLYRERGRPDLAADAAKLAARIEGALAAL